MITMKEVELFAGLMSRAGVTQIEAMFANSFLSKLREMAKEKVDTPTKGDAS